MGEFSGKKALVVGGSGGIGKEISRLLASEGAHLVVHAGHESEKLRSFVAELGESCPEAAVEVIVQALGGDFAALETSELVRAAAESDIQVVSFGPFVQKSLEETTLSDWQTVALYDYALPGLLVSKALAHMKKRRWGRILLFGGTGTAHRTEFLTNAAYAGAKAGINVLTASAAAAYAGYGITCNAILPGPTMTEYTKGAEELAGKMPGGKLNKAASVAEKALFLLKNDSLNGTILRVDGGWSPMAVLGS